jgi:uncharacterized repeat protein (TIGR01451 family)
LAFENTGLLELPPYLPDEIETRSTLCATFPPILSVQVTDGRNTICMGDSVTYSVTVVNRGPQNVAANNVVLVDTLPAGSVFINASSSSGSCDHAGGVVTCNLGTLAFGDSANAIITAAIGSSCEDPVNLAVVAHDETDRDIRDTDTTSVQACVALDIKPGSCRNPVNFQGNYEAGQSVVPAAILGSETFDVRDVDVSSLRLLGVAPVRSSDEDVSGVVGAFTDTCRCFSDGADGHEDLTLKFDKAELIKAMYDYHGHGILPERGDKVILTITGRLRCDAPLVGYDCVVPLHVLWPPPLTTLPSEIDMAESDDDPVKDATPMLRIPDLQNPSEIRFSVPEGTRVRLEVFDIAGRLVSTIDDRWVSPGEHAVSWADGGHASGIYFLRMTTQSHVISRKVVMLH